MLKQLSPIVLLNIIQKTIEKNIGVKCYLDQPNNIEPPFYFLELKEKKVNDSETMYKLIYTVLVHVIVEMTGSSVPVEDYIQMLEEAMNEDIIISDGFQLIMQFNNGTQTIKTDNANEEHAMLEYMFDVCNGYKCK